MMRKRQIVLYSGLLLGVAILILSTRVNLGKMVQIIEQRHVAISFQSNSSSSSMDAAAQKARDIIASRHRMQKQLPDNDKDMKQLSPLRAFPSSIQQQQDKKVLLEQRKIALTITALNETSVLGIKHLKPPPQKPRRQPPLQQKQQQPQQLQQLHLEFVHIPKTGGSAIEQAAFTSRRPPHQKIRWGAFHYNQNRIPSKRRFLGAVPYWHLPSSYYDSHDYQKSNVKNCNTTLYCFDPYGPNPYQVKPNTKLFTIVRDPYARAVSEYHFYHREVKRFARVERYNTAPQMNAWLFRHLTLLRRALVSESAHRQIQQHAQQAHYLKTFNITTTGNTTTFTRMRAKKPSVMPATVDIDNTHLNNNNQTTIQLLMNTAAEWRNWPFQTKMFRKAYYAQLGHFIPQYDFVYNGFSNTPLIHHVLHFETLHVEFANLMQLYHLPVVLPQPHNKKNASHHHHHHHHHDNNNNNSTNSTTTTTTSNMIQNATITTSAQRQLQQHPYVAGLAGGVRGPHNSDATTTTTTAVTSNNSTTATIIPNATITTSAQRQLQQHPYVAGPAAGGVRGHSANSNATMTTTTTSVTSNNTTNNNNNTTSNSNSNNTTTSNKTSPSTQHVDLVGVQNLTEANRRLIELIYARDFLAFGYKMMPPVPVPPVAAGNASAAATTAPPPQ